MTITFSERWQYYSWHRRRSTRGTDGIRDEHHEVELINRMIVNSDSRRVRTYALNDAEIGVHVRTGLHTSKEEKRNHVQVVLGSNDPETWKVSDSNSGYTAHIIYHKATGGRANNRYETHVWPGQHHLKRVGRRKS